MADCTPPRSKKELALNNAINADVKKLRRLFLALQLFAPGYGWRYASVCVSRHTGSSSIYDIQTRSYGLSLICALIVHILL